MSTYYIKRGKRYIPVGFDGPELHDGIWLVETEDHCVSRKNLRIRLDDLPDPKDLKILASATRLEKIILRVLLECWKDNKGCSLADAATKLCQELTTQELNLRKKLTTKDLR